MGWQGEPANSTPPDTPKGGFSTLIGFLLFILGVGWAFISIAIPLQVNFASGCTLSEGLSVIRLLDVIGSLISIAAGVFLMLQNNKRNNG